MDRTNAERQRRYIARLKAAAEQNRYRQTTKRGLAPETIQNLEQCCAKMYAEYNQAVRKKRVAEQEARSRMTTLKGRGMWLRAREEFNKRKYKFMDKPNRLRYQAETILTVLKWAAPNKKRDERLRSINDELDVTYQESPPALPPARQIGGEL